MEFDGKVAIVTGGSQGTGQDLSTGGQVPVRFLSTVPSGAVSAPGPNEDAVARVGEGSC